MGNDADLPRVLVVGTAGELRTHLEGAGFAVTHAGTVESSLAWLDENRSDAVVGEHDLPESDGNALVERVNATRPDVPVVVYTDDGSERLAGRLFAAGAAGYVPHADGPAVVRERLEEVLDRTDEDDADVTNRYRHLVEASPVAINLFDAEGITVYGNQAVVDLLGLQSRAELIGRSIFEFIHPDDRDVAEEELTTVLTEKRSVGPTRMDLQRPDGEVRHVQVATAPGRYEGREVAQAVAVDVTPLREVQRELEEERRFIDDALDALPDIFFFVAPTGELERWNETAETVCGYGPEELRAMDVNDLFVEEDVDAVFDAIGTVFREGHDSVEARVLTSDGRAIPHEFRGRLLESDDGTRVGVVGIGRDVSTRNARERELRTIDRVLRHNLRNALTTIGGRAELIQAESAGEVATSADTIVRTTESLLATADKQRTVVHLLTERPATTDVDVVSAVSTVIDAMEDRHPQATIDTDLPDDARALAIPELSLAVFELVDNAVRHHDDPAPAVDVVVERNGAAVRVSVLDTGPTIPESEIDAIGEASTDQDQLTHGQGIGLWLVHLVATLSSGSLAFGENDPRGNVVTIEVQAAESDEPSRNRSVE